MRCLICSMNSPCRTPRSVRKSDADALIGTGPFRVTAWEPGRRLTLAAFDDYWGGTAVSRRSGDRVRPRTRTRRPVRYPGWPRATDTSGRLCDVVVRAALAGRDHSNQRRPDAAAGARAGDRSRAHRECARAAQGRSGVRFAAAVALAAMRSCSSRRRMSCARSSWCPHCDWDRSASATRRTICFCDRWPSAWL